jgi:hypothetical protein
MAVPADFDSYAFGVELTSSNYSGGAGGTFTDLVLGTEHWTVNGATPSFSTKSGSGWSQDGMDFANSATESVLGASLPILREGTFVAVYQTGSAGTQYVLGHNNSAAAAWSMAHNAYRIQATNTVGASGYTAAHTTSARPVVAAVSFSPENGEFAATTFDGTLRKMTAIDTSWRDPCFDHWTMCIGRARTTYWTGWISRVYGFNRALHFRDETGLDALIDTLGAEIGV